MSRLVFAFFLTCTCAMSQPAAEDPSSAGTPPSRSQAAQRVDDAIEEAVGSDAQWPPLANDGRFLRRVHLDLAGKLPTAEDLRVFGLDENPAKRQRVVKELLASSSYPRHWSRYWRDAIFARAQDQRARGLEQGFEEWLSARLAEDMSWAETVTDIVTAIGPTQGRGQTALVMAQMGQAAELAAETSRLFLGIQIQCAQCHDHPYDDWKREQFHELAAFFPRLRIQRQSQSKPPSFEVVSLDATPKGPPAPQDPARFLARYDRDKNGEVAADELPKALRKKLAKALRRADKDKSGGLNAKELRALRSASKKRGGREHYMPDLENPEKRGTLTHPVFFVDGSSPGEGLSDADRRQALARYLTAAENPWLARSLVNRIWARMTGTGFVEPVDDMGPARPPRFAAALEVLSEGFRANGYSLRWLVGTICLTRVYQREGAWALPLAAAEHASRHDPRMCAVRLSADQLFSSLAHAVGLSDESRGSKEKRRKERGQNPRRLFQQIFRFDPSTPSAEVKGTIQQALFLMNSPILWGRLQARSGTFLGGLLSATDDDEQIVRELYLRVLARQPSSDELSVCLSYRKRVDSRAEAFEDMYWSLLNTAEFLVNH